MGNIFNIDSKPVAFLTKITDLIILSILWILCSLPILTIGVSTTALYFVTLKIVRKEEVHVSKLFFSAIKENFIQGILMTSLILAFSVLIGIDYVFLINTGGVVPQILVCILVPVSFLCFMTISFVFPLQAQYRNTIQKTIKNAFLLSLGNIPSSLLIIFIHILPVSIILLPFEFLIKLLPILIFLVPSGIAYMCSLRYVKIFAKLEKVKDEVTE